MKNKIKKILKTGFFKVVDEETFDKEVFIKNLRIGGFSLLTGALIGAIISSDSSTIQELETEISNISRDRDEYNELASERSDEILSLKSSKESLQAKVDSAKAWFELEEIEQDSIREEVAQKKAEKEAKEQAEKEAEQVAKAKAEEEEKERKKVEKANEDAKNEASGDALVEEGLRILRENMGRIAKISYKNDTSTFIVTPTEEGFKSDLLGVSQGKYLSEWDSVVDGMVRLSYSMKSVLPGKSIALMNPFNEGNFLLLVKDGMIMYDFIEE